MHGGQDERSAGRAGEGRFLDHGRALAAKLAGHGASVPRLPSMQVSNTPLCRLCTVGRVQELDITPKMARVLKVFLEDPGQPRYGYELMKVTGMPSGSLYPMLAKFEEAGWLTRGKENIDPRAAGRPPRMHYTITGAAVSAARVQLAALSERYRPPAPGHLRPQGSTA